MLVGAVGMSALGTQLAGTVDAVGKETNGFARGDRVAFPGAGLVETGRLIVEERELVGVPADVGLDVAAAILPCALLARTVVKQVHSVRSGDRVRVDDGTAIAPFVRAWVNHLGGTVVEDAPADVTVTTADIRAARGGKTGHGLAQQAAADVFAAARAGAFDAIALSTPDEARRGSRAPVLVRMPATHTGSVTLSKSATKVGLAA